MRELFPAYYDFIDEDITKLWETGIFVFDTNMLLNIYRYNNETRNRFYEILDRLKTRIWIPFQVALEYQDNRIEVIDQQFKVYSEVSRALKNAKNILDSLNGLKERHSFIKVDELTEASKTALSSANAKLTQEQTKNKEEFDNLKSFDDRREQFDELFKGKVGIPYSKDELRDLYKQAEKRFELQIPPGWKDKRKKEYNKYGDVILWFQMLDFAKSIKKPILFVTDDGKSDWYLSKEESKGIMKPRPELVQEMLVEANVIVQLYQGYEFLDKATNYLDLQQKPEVIEEAKEISEQNTLEIERSKYDVQAFERLAFQAVEAVYKWLKERYPGKFIKRFPDFGIDYILETESGERIGVIIKYSNQNFTRIDIMQINNDIERQMDRYKRNIFFIVCGNKKEADDTFANFKQINFEAMKVELRVGYITSFGYFVTVDDREE